MWYIGWRDLAPIAQGIEHRSPEPGAQVRILLGAPYMEKGPLTSSEEGGLFVHGEFNDVVIGDETCERRERN